MEGLFDAVRFMAVRRSVVVLGKGTLAIRVAGWFLASDEYELRHVVPVVPEPQWTDSLIDWARSHSVPYVESGHFRDAPEEECDLGVSIFYDKIVSADYIARFERMLNLHNAPLPRYRGVSPINWALKNGESSHGVTIHEITPGVDDGPVVAKLEYSIYPDHDEVADVYNRALEYGWVLFQQTLPILDRIEPTPQNDAEATYYSAKENSLLGERSGFTRALSAASK